VSIPGRVVRSSCRTSAAKLIPRFILYKYGAWLRNRSPAALHDDQIEEQDNHPEASVQRGKNIEKKPHMPSQ
jgi:hypothetical protein